LKEVKKAWKTWEENGRKGAQPVDCHHWRPSEDDPGSRRMGTKEVDGGPL